MLLHRLIFSVGAGTGTNVVYFLIVLLVRVNGLGYHHPHTTSIPCSKASEPHALEINEL
jgi:hypothetical protein